MGSPVSSYTGILYNTPTQVKVGPGRLGKVCTNNPSGSVLLYDCATTGGVGWSNFIGYCNGLGPVEFDWPFVNGLVVVMGNPNSAYCSVSFD